MVLVIASTKNSKEQQNKTKKICTENYADLYKNYKSERVCLFTCSSFMTMPVDRSKII